MRARDLTQFCGTIMVCLGLLAAWGGCRDSSAPEAAETPASAMTTESQVATGTVRYIELEGGFYGIVTDDGRKLDPVNLPAEFQKDGLRLEARVAPLRDRVSIHMWGTPVRIIEFKRL